MKYINHVRQNQVYSGIENLPKGTAPDTIIEGCAVLEGGAFRGVYGEGVLDAMMEQGLNLSCTIGVSAGALNGLNYGCRATSDGQRGQTCAFDTMTAMWG